MNNNALSVANKFIDLAEADGAQLTPLKLVKLTYLAHGFALVFLKNGETIIDPRFDKVEAWKYGPVIPSVYHTFKYLRDGAISSADKATIYDKGQYVTPRLEGELPNKIVTFVWNRYRKMTAEALVDMLHRDGTPWAKTYRVGKTEVIPDEITKDYYERVSELIKKNMEDGRYS